MLIKSILSVLLVACLQVRPAAAGGAVLPLAGEWRFQLDPNNEGINDEWFAKTLEDTIRLPGTTDEHRKGTQQDEGPVDRLARPWFWKGPAWYQREVDIPEAWAGQRITLFLERTKHTRVWANGNFRGWNDTLSTPQEFDLTGAVSPGRHTLSVLVDNSKLPPVGPAHAVDERTQTNWNGIIGRIELRATDPVWIEDVRVFPEAANKRVRLRVTIGNITGRPAAGTLQVGCASANVPEPVAFAPHSVSFAASGTRQVMEFIYQPGEAVPLWDEFNPALLRLDLQLAAGADGQRFADQRSVTFGLRDFTRDGNRLLVNGRRVYLRGRVDCANYPLTGYAPMDLASWRRVFAILKEWGLNHVRFHSWCPPAAAFQAADEAGFFLQAELPNKRSAFNAPDDDNAAIHNIDFLDINSTATEVTLFDYGKREGGLILRHFGNHPSFTMFTLGNELGRNPGMFELVAHFKQLDPTRLHAQGSNNMHWSPSLADGDDFWVTAKLAKASLPLRGAFSLPDYPDPHIETRPPSTMVDFGASIRGVPVPMIGHETGAFQVAPDFRDIPKFTGVLRARNYETFRERLEAAGLLDQAHDFVRASGALAALCYREDIEAALRTPDMAGFQLLDIMDFPGQGTALVGMLNVFMEDKGVIRPEVWRDFCRETVPLLRMEKHTWTTGETFTGRVQVAHYGPADLPDARVTWTVGDDRGKSLARGVFPPRVLPTGRLNEVDSFELPLAEIAAPRQLTVTLAIEGTSYRNSYPLWVYPDKVDTAAPEGVMIARDFNGAETQAHLASGGKVLLLPPLDRLPHSVRGAFQTDYWSPMFAQSAIKRGLEPPPGTLGILCDPTHPALAAFPTGFHSNWQWWHLVRNARPLVLDETPGDYRPIIQVIDNFTRNHKLGLLAETKVGAGAMLICPIDLPGHLDEPAVRQFLHSLLRYISSPAFAPQQEIDAGLLRKLLP